MPPRLWQMPVSPWRRYGWPTTSVQGERLKANEGSAERFLAAITRAHRFMYENKNETVKIVAKATGFAPKVIEQAYARLLARNAVFPVNDGLDEGRLTHTLARISSSGCCRARRPRPRRSSTARRSMRRSSASAARRRTRVTSNGDTLAACCVAALDASDPSSCCWPPAAAVATR
jgi:hypothetical protein